MIAFKIQNKAATLFALDVVGRITANTLAGIDKDGLPFKVYQGKYVMLKKLKRPGDGGKVNLSDTGRMLGALTPLSVSGNKITIGFKRGEEAEKMQDNISMGRNPMGLPAQDLHKLVDKYSSQLFELIEI